MKLKVLLTSACFLFVLPLLVTARDPKPPVVKWTDKSPFERKEFIENKGQFSIPSKRVNSADILFGANRDGLEYYFTKNSIWINYTTTANSKNIVETHEINFAGANPDVQVTTENKVSNYYIYRMGNSSVTANAYKKLVYTNLYPGIDMTFYFPADKQGFEYEFTVHPGADISQIKMQYPSNENLNITPDGNIDIKAVYGDFIDHAPVATQASANAVSCSFNLNRDMVQFNVGKYDKSMDLKIDPWVVSGSNLTFKGTANNDACDVDWDDGGNCYAYGGRYHWTLNKYNSAGTLLWQYQETFASATGFLGHFAVDRITHSAYIGEGFDITGSEMVKLSDNGTVMVANKVINANLQKIWRVAFSRCEPHVGVVGGGNSNHTNTGPYYNAFLLDTVGLNGNAPVNVLNATSGYHDVCLLTLDNSGNAYMAFSESLLSGNFNNAFIRVPAVASLSPIAWDVADGYKFVTSGSVVFGPGSNGNTSPQNGFGGATYSNNDSLYTYDSYKLKKWNSVTGALSLTTTVNTNPQGDSSMYWGGLTSDVCNHIFIGSKNSILEYNSNLVNVSTVANEGDSVFDVRLGNHNMLYAGGAGFVTAIQVNLGFCIPFTIDTQVVNATCTRKGQGSVIMTGGTSPYRFAWTVLGSTTVFDTTAIADSLVEGSYVVTVIDTSCMPETITDTIHVKRIATFPTVNVAPSPTHVCLGASVVLTASGNATSYTWSPSSTLSATTGTVVTATPTATTTYYIMGFAAGECPGLDSDIVTVDTLPNIRVTPNPASVCTGSGILLTASGAATYVWKPGATLSGTTGTSVTATPTATEPYTITGTNGNGCVDSTTITVTVNPYPVVTVTPDSTGLCFNGAPVTLSSNSNIGPATYAWFPANGLSGTTGSSVTAAPTASTTYYASATVNGCTDSVPDTVTVLPIPQVVIGVLDTAFCINAAPVEIVQSMPYGGTFSGAGITDSTFTPSAAGVGGPYTITYTYTSPNGCTNSDSTKTKVVALPVITIMPANPAVCSGTAAVLTASGASTYVWVPGTGLNETTGSSVSASPSVATTYLVTGTSTYGCIDTASKVVNIGSNPLVGYTMNVPNECNSLLIQFLNADTATGDTYLWEFGDSTTSNGVSPEHLYKHGAAYRVSLVVTNVAGCVDSIANIENVAGLNQIAVFPNAFTPDCNCQYNGFFGPHIICSSATDNAYTFRVYNRWGQMVYQSNNPSDPGWDGTLNNKAEPVDVYVYYLQFICGDCPISEKGNVTLLR